MISVDAFLSSSAVLSVLLCSVLTGFAATLLFLHAHDTRVFDKEGQFIPSPQSSLWDINVARLLAVARSGGRLSTECCRLLTELGDGDIVGFNSILGRQTIVVAHPELVKCVLSGHHLKFARPATNHRSLSFLLGKGLCTSEGMKWHESRQALAPGFQAEHLNAMIPNFNRQSQKLIAYWRSNVLKLKKVQPDATSIPVHLKDDLNSLIMSAMCYSCFGYDFQKDERRDSVSAAFAALRTEVGARSLDRYSWWHWLSPTRTRTTQAALHTFREMLDEVIGQRLREHSALLVRRRQRAGSRLDPPSQSSSVQGSPAAIVDGSDTSQADDDRAITEHHLSTPLAHRRTDSKSNNNNRMYTTPDLTTGGPVTPFTTPCTTATTSRTPTTTGATAGAVPPPISSTGGAPGSLLQRMFTVSPQKASETAGAGAGLPLRDIEAVESPVFTPPGTVRSGGGASVMGSPNSPDSAGYGGTGREGAGGREWDLLDWLVQCGNSSSAGEGGGGSGGGGGGKLSHTEIRDQLCTFLLAGHEATAACLQWTIYELCRHPEVQARCQAEVDAVLAQLDAEKEREVEEGDEGDEGNEDEEGIREEGAEKIRHRAQQKAGTKILPARRPQFLGSADVNRLCYLVQVLKESMRLHPVTGSIVRRCETDCTVGEFTLRPGTTVIVNALAVHRHPDFWTDPLLFKPERFSKDNIRATVKHPYQYLPFSAGPHSCIGQRMGLMQVLVVLGSLLANFTFALAAKDSKSVQEEETFTIHPKDLNVVVSLRSGV